MIRRPQARKQLQKGIYLLPSSFTVGTLFCGFYSIIATLEGDFGPAAAAIGIAMVLDGLDGRIARLTNSTTSFGETFDSLADVLTFGMAPAALMFAWSLRDTGRFGWAVTFFFLSCSAARLARFTVQTAHNDRRYFAGLPAPPAGALLAAIAFYAPEPGGTQVFNYALLALISIVSLLMISKIRYRSFKDIDLKQRRPYSSIAPLAIVLALIVNAPQAMLLLLATTYAVSGPVEKLLQLRRRGGVTAATDPDATEHTKQPALDTDE